MVQRLLSAVGLIAGVGGAIFLIAFAADLALKRDSVQLFAVTTASALSANYAVDDSPITFAPLSPDIIPAVLADQGLAIVANPPAGNSTPSEAPASQVPAISTPLSLPTEVAAVPITVTPPLPVAPTVPLPTATPLPPTPTPILPLPTRPLPTLPLPTSTRILPLPTLPLPLPTATPLLPLPTLPLPTLPLPELLLSNSNGSNV